MDLGPAYHQKDNFGTPMESVAKEFDLTLLDINTFLDLPPLLIIYTS